MKKNKPKFKFELFDSCSIIGVTHKHALNNKKIVEKEGYKKVKYEDFDLTRRGGSPRYMIDHKDKTYFDKFLVDTSVEAIYLFYFIYTRGKKAKAEKILNNLLDDLNTEIYYKAGKPLFIFIKDLFLEESLCIAISPYLPGGDDEE